ncbi:unnamed protein product [Symbiodinium sp. KB8]|nr:unnamed protein product [Symbiodinium sp. KB8]
MGNRLSVPTGWRPAAAFDGVTDDLGSWGPRIAAKTGAWVAYCGALALLLQLLRKKGLLGKAFPKISSVKALSSLFSLTHAVGATLGGIDAFVLEWLLAEWFSDGRGGGANPLAAAEPPGGAVAVSPQPLPGSLDHPVRRRAPSRDTALQFFSCSPSATRAVEWSVAYMIADAVLMLAEGDELLGWAPALHHLIVAFGFARGIASGFTTQYHSLFLVNEASVVPMHLLVLGRSLGGRAQVATGVALWVLFLVSRLGFNAWIFSNVAWHLGGGPRADAAACSGSPASRSAAARRQLLSDPSTFRELVLQLGLAGSAQVLNVMWFAQITALLLARLSASEVQ